MKRGNEIKGQSRHHLQPDLLKLLVDSRNKAELMLAMAQNSDAEAQRLYHELAEAFSLSARLIEELKSTLKSKDPS